MIAVPDPKARSSRFKKYGETVHTEFHNTDPNVEFDSYDSAVFPGLWTEIRPQP